MRHPVGIKGVVPDTPSQPFSDGLFTRHSIDDEGNEQRGSCSAWDQGAGASVALVLSRDHRFFRLVSERRRGRPAFSAASAPSLNGPSLAILVTTGAVGVAGAFWLDFRALQLIGSRAVSVLFSLDPAIGAVTGAILLSQHLDSLTVAGLAAVIASGAVAATTSSAGSSEHVERGATTGQGRQAPGR